MHCDVAHELWFFVFSLFGGSLGSAQGVMFGWKNWSGKHFYIF